MLVENQNPNRALNIQTDAKFKSVEPGENDTVVICFEGEEGESLNLTIQRSAAVKMITGVYRLLAWK